ncbi:MAG: hypothetical protein VW683_12240 [Betaproteobacteria bacterium]
MKSIKELRNELNESKQEDIIGELQEGRGIKRAIYYLKGTGIQRGRPASDGSVKVKTDVEEDLWTFADENSWVTIKDIKFYEGDGDDETMVHFIAMGPFPNSEWDKFTRDLQRFDRRLTFERYLNEEVMIDKLMKEEVEEEPELDEAMSRAARIKRSKIMKRLQPKIKRAKERAAKKKASSDVIDKRAEKQAKEVLIKKWLKGKSKSDVPFAERERIEGKLKKSKKAIDRIKKKLFKVIRKQEAEKFTKKESTELD